MSHSGGLRAETGEAWWERTPGGDFEQLTSTTLNGGSRFEAGRRFHYSNVGFGVLGEVVGRIRGQRWDEVVKRELLEPLGMHRTTTRPQQPAAPGLAVHPWADLVLPEPEHDAGAMAPAGQLWTTVEDLARWAAFLSGHGPDLLSADTLAEMREPRVIVDMRDEQWVAAYGLGLQVFNSDGRRAFGHGGSMPGFLAGLEIQEDGDALVEFCNATRGLTDLGEDLLKILAEQEPRLPDEWVPAAVAEGDAGAAGRVVLGAVSVHPGRARRRAGVDDTARRAVARRASRPRVRTRGSDSTATTPASRCGSSAARTARSRTWISGRSCSRGRRMTRMPTSRAASTRAAGEPDPARALRVAPAPEAWRFRPEGLTRSASSVPARMGTTPYPAPGCPMLSHQQSQEGMMFKRILCATDGSEHGDRALRQAARMALADDGELHLAHVIERIPGGGRLGGQNVFLTESEIDSRIVRQGRGDGPAGGGNAEVHLVRGAGHPAKQLAELAERIDADLIVLGSRGHSPLAGVVLGSVTQQLLHATGRPVLALPPARAVQRRAAPVPAAVAPA